MTKNFPLDKREKPCYHAPIRAMRRRVIRFCGAGRELPGGVRKQAAHRVTYSSEPSAETASARRVSGIRCAGYSVRGMTVPP